MLMAAKNLAHQTTRARTCNGVADFTRSDNAKAWSPLPFFRIRAPPVKYQATFDDALAFQPSAFKFPAPLQALRLREPERLPGWSLARHVNSRIKPESSACGPRDGDWPGHRDRSSKNCGSEIRADVCVAFWKVDIVVSYSDSREISVGLPGLSLLGFLLRFFGFFGLLAFIGF